MPYSQAKLACAFKVQGFMNSGHTKKGNIWKSLSHWNIAILVCMFYYFSQCKHFLKVGVKAYWHII